ncbi:MAG: AAA family ATPase [Alphaproteobacteria bacterium]|nr:AAA family ATPase [Alphaproteobacteria bacterium]
MMESLYSYQNQLLASTEFFFRRSFIDSVEWNDRLIGIVGARGAGKTTCLLQRLQDIGTSDLSNLYVTLDNLSNPYSTLIALAETFHSRGGKVLILDEIHKYPGWAGELKNIYDRFPRLKVIYSGSSTLKIRDEAVDLSRRAVVYQLQGLSFREYLEIIIKCSLPKISLHELLNDHIGFSIRLIKDLKPLAYFKPYLKNGYFPFFLQSEKTYLFKLQAIINYILESEIPGIINIEYRNIQKMKRALQYIAANLPYQPNISKLAESIELNRNSLLTYLGLMERAGIITSLYQSGSFYGKLTKPGKILLHHPNLSFALNSGEANIGNLRECFFVNQLAHSHKVELAVKGDFMIDGKYLFEIGGKGKKGKQIAGMQEAFIVADDLETGFDNKIPLWLFGFLY